MPDSDDSNKQGQGQQGGSNGNDDFPKPIEKAKADKHQPTTREIRDTIRKIKNKE